MNPTDDYYARHSDAFIESTLHVDMQELYQRFTQQLPKNAAILDLGSGSGRDSKAFKEMGYHVLAIDACEQFVTHTRNFAHVDTHRMSFEEIDFENAFDGVWACASLLHLKSEQLGFIFKKINRSLKPNGILYVSFKSGDFEGIHKGRWFTHLNPARFKSIMSQVREFETIDIWLTNDARPERKDEQWLNGLIRKQSP